MAKDRMTSGMGSGSKMLMAWATLNGWCYGRTAGGHIKFTHPLIRTPVFTSSTPRCTRGWKNARSDMRKLMKMAMVVELRG